MAQTTISLKIGNDNEGLWFVEGFGMSRKRYEGKPVVSLGRLSLIINLHSNTSSNAVFGWINSYDLAQNRHCGHLISASCQPLCVHNEKQRAKEPLSGGNYEYKVMHYRFAGEFIYSPAKVGNVSRPNQCGGVHLCPPNHLLMATINCLPTASASSTFAIKVNRRTLYCRVKVL